MSIIVLHLPKEKAKKEKNLKKKAHFAMQFITVIVFTIRFNYFGNERKIITSVPILKIIEFYPLYLKM